jgi:hypothetical protein
MCASARSAPFSPLAICAEIPIVKVIHHVNCEMHLSLENREAFVIILLIILILLFGFGGYRMGPGIGYYGGGGISLILLIILILLLLKVF